MGFTTPNIVALTFYVTTIFRGNMLYCIPSHSLQ
jgi:hypothetical protein